MRKEYTLVKPITMKNIENTRLKNLRSNLSKIKEDIMSKC